MCIYSLVSLSNGISNFVVYLMLKLSLKKKHEWYYSTRSWENNRVLTFANGISLEEYVIGKLELKLV